MDDRFDVLVIGGGPAGVTAAIRARELGARVGLIEAGRLGGTCTNDGCVPTRVLARAARLVRDAGQFADYGLRGDPPAVDFAAVMARAQAVVGQIHAKKDLPGHLERAGVQSFSGEARFLDRHTLRVGADRLAAEKIIICAGGRASRLPFAGNQHALTVSDVWGLRELPRRVAIIGAAATGCQLASVLAAFGADVTLLETLPTILASEDDSISGVIGRSFAERGITVVAGIGGVERLQPVEGGYRLDYRRDDQEHALEIDAVIIAAGWPGNVDRLDLEAAGVVVDGRRIVVDDHLRTSAPNIFAAGDITGRVPLVQTASADARIAAENAVLGDNRRNEHTIVPHGGFTDPEYGSVGLSEARARAAGDCAVATVPYRDIDRAVIDGQIEGSCKLIVDRASRCIIGAHIAGEDAVEIAQLVAACMAAEARVEQLAALELAYPTYTAIVGLAAREIARELGQVPVAPSWRSLIHQRPAEWERSQPHHEE